VLLSKILDDLVPIPGTKQSIGADAIAAFVPGIGNAAGTAMSGVVIADAIRLRVPLPILGRMLFNVGIDAAVGYVPVAGPFLDAAWRANRRNMKLLERTLLDEHRTAQSSVAYLVVAITLSATVLVALLASAVFALWTVAKFLNWVAF